MQCVYFMNKHFTTTPERLIQAFGERLLLIEENKVMGVCGVAVHDLIENSVGL